MKTRTSFQKDESALAWIWAMCIICIALSAVIYFPLSYTWDHLYNYIAGQYTFTGDTAFGLATIKLILSFLLALVLVALINWSIVNAKAENYSGY